MNTRIRLATGFLAALSAVPVVSHAALTLQNASATFNQDLGNHHISNAIDGNTADNTLCWGTFGGHTSIQSAVFQLATVNNDAAWQFDLFFAHFATGHKLQHFRISATTSVAPTTSSGAVWTQLTPTFADSIWAGGATTETIFGDNTVRVAGVSESGGAFNAQWTVTASNPSLVNVTGFRLEAFPFDDNGAGGATLGFQAGANNGNIALTEFTATAVPEPTAALLGLAGLAGFAARRRRRVL